MLSMGMGKVEKQYLAQVNDCFANAGPLANTTRMMLDGEPTFMQVAILARALGELCADCAIAVGDNDKLATYITAAAAALALAAKNRVDQQQQEKRP